MTMLGRQLRVSLAIALGMGGLTYGMGTASAAEQVFPRECFAYQFLTEPVLHQFLGSTNLQLSVQSIKTERGYQLGHNWCLLGETLVRLGHTIVGEQAPSNPEQLREDFRINVIQALDQELGAPPEDFIYGSKTVRIALQGALENRFDIVAPRSQRIDGPVAVQQGEANAQAPLSGGDEGESSQGGLDSEGLAEIAGRATDDPVDLRPSKNATGSKRRVPPGGAGCRTEDKIRGSQDRDVQKYADVIVGNGLCYTVKTIEEHGNRWNFQTFSNTGHPDGPVWYLPHDNENTAFRAALYAVTTYGGKFLTLHTKEKRNLNVIDPNRNFGLTKKEVAACKSISGRPTPKYTGEVMRAFKGRATILTMHNNTNGGTVSAAHSDDKNTGMPAAKNSRRISGDMDDFIYVTGTKPLSRDPRVKEDIVALRRAGVNVVHEFVTLRNTDCSLSNHAALNQKRYFNIEAQHGHLEAQIKMINALMKHLGFKPI